MRIAFYIAAHHKAYQFRWLFEALRPGGDSIFVHVDKRAPAAFFDEVRTIAGARADAQLLPRMAVLWGGWSQVSSELAAIRQALLADPDWRYFVNLSGQDYPLKPLEDIRATLAAAWPASNIDVMTYDQVRADDPNNPTLRKQAAVEIGGRVKLLPLRLPTSPVGTDYKGSQWHMLSRGFCEWLVSDPAPRRLGWFFRFADVPDEAYFQAAFMSSPFREERMSELLRYFRFPGPKVLDSGDLPELAASPALFARKFDAEVDREVLEALAARIGAQVPPR